MEKLLHYGALVLAAYLIAAVVHEATHWFVATCFRVKLHWKWQTWRLVFDFTAPSRFATLCIKRAGFTGEVIFGFLMTVFPAAWFPFGLSPSSATVGFLCLVFLRMAAYRILLRDSPYNDFAPVD